ncbi:MAG: HAD-IA family hydrolase [Pseudomonadales bacterium]|nr:HAD-IA family hydrolase [Pseudomonadales bacterium]NRA14372.1 HAD-IA family hydrolase [Oceanospirillaceae bacterium]
MIKCVIFDCDGTLVDSEYLCNLALQIKLREHAVVESADQLMHKYRGGKLATILQSIEVEHNIQLADDFVVAYRTLVEQLFSEKLEACAGVAQMLADLRLAKCVASSGPLHKIHSALSITDLDKYFEGNIYSSYQIDSWKPDPGIFLHAATQMGFAPHQCVVVEDSLVGVTAAMAAGMQPILYDPLKIHAVPAGVISIGDMSELQSVIDKI